MRYHTPRYVPSLSSDTGFSIHFHYSARRLSIIEIRKLERSHAFALPIRKKVPGVASTRDIDLNSCAAHHLTAGDAGLPHTRYSSTTRQHSSMWQLNKKVMLEFFFINRWK